MKQREIDRWVNRQTRMNRRFSFPAVNWVQVAAMLIVISGIVIMVLKAAHLL